jgi:hypothetical protein
LLGPLLQHLREVPQHLSRRGVGRFDEGVVALPGEAAPEYGHRLCEPLPSILGNAEDVGDDREGQRVGKRRD